MNMELDYKGMKDVEGMTDWICSKFMCLDGPPRAFVEFPVYNVVGEVMAVKRVVFTSFVIKFRDGDSVAAIGMVLKAFADVRAENHDESEILIWRKQPSISKEADGILVMRFRFSFWNERLNEAMTKTVLYQVGTSEKIIVIVPMHSEDRSGERKKF